MTARAVAAEVDRLDALSRSRALNDRESRQLQKLIAMQRRYASMRAANDRAKVGAHG